INAVVDIFKGQPLNKSDFSIEIQRPEGELQFGNEFVVGNNLVLDEETILKNVQEIQKSNEVGVSDKLFGMNFSVEMETGTGKTYVYLRTIHELYKRYGFQKFVIVVPSLAIKEGVLKNLQITQEHFDVLYENPEMDFYVYDPKKRGQLKNFATTNALQVLLINIDSFAKFNKDKAGKNIIYQDSDWGIPIQYIQSVKPITIIDEPQTMETEIRKQAISNLNPLCTFRFSATHKYPYNLMYKLDPVKAYDLGLVKKIEVDSVFEEGDFNEAFIELVSVKSQKNTITIQLKIDVKDKSGVKRKTVSIKKSPKKATESDLFKLSNERDVYKDGYVIESVDVAGKSLTFSNGKTFYIGQTQDDQHDDILKYQIYKSVLNHFEKERRLKQKGIKVLSLFFIDKVANYRQYTDGQTKSGKFAQWFEEIYNEISSKSGFKGVIPYEAEEVHNGYFAQDKKGVLKDTKGNTQADDEAYTLIMKDKERLLGSDVPLRFIFSHSALREGWDNPNVFQICTLREITSEGERRQTIGRGLRLPVNQDGVRVFDETVNVLTVVANEGYESFAKNLQTEIEDECGVEFTGRIKNKADRKKVRLKKGYMLDENFKALWDKIKNRTRYSVEYHTDDLIKETVKALSDVEITAPRLLSVKGQLNITDEGVTADLTGVAERYVDYGFKSRIPDVLGYIQSKTRLTKDTIFKIIKQSGKLDDIFINPQQFMDIFSSKINAVLNSMMIDGIKYEKIADKCWEMKQFENEELESYLQNLYKVSNQDKTLYDHVLVDSNVENDFARELETREDVKFYLKLPYWFKIETPIGSYNPDWAIVFENDKRIYFVAETKSAEQELRESEKLKIKCGKKYFEEFEEVNFKAPVSKLSEIVI
ncbi:MAG: DEAD/DEAH box helicase family protein, partial [Candidatus Omnitrophica bacterium]|nr:DEAD/DEAH box helicase family protein [Candidatus Omnitrophota bacterium]